MLDRLPVVLLVEDSPADQEIIRRAFANSHPKVDLRMVLDGESALSYMERRDRFAPPAEAPMPDLILLDLNLPNLTGREVLERIRTTRALRHVPVVILTTTQAQHEIMECYRLGANCFLTKPAGFPQFVKLLEQTCSFWFNLATLPLPAAEQA
jgi:CheY-like chemotaxis protein